VRTLPRPGSPTCRKGRGGGRVLRPQSSGCCTFTCCFQGLTAPLDLHWHSTFSAAQGQTVTWSLSRAAAHHYEHELGLVHAHVQPECACCAISLLDLHPLLHPALLGLCTCTIERWRSWGRVTCAEVWSGCGRGVGWGKSKA